jgi:hypothetical protein
LIPWRASRHCLSRKAMRKPKPTRPRQLKPIRQLAIACLGSRCKREARRKEPLRKAILPSTAVCSRLLAGLSIPTIPLSAKGFRRLVHRRQVRLRLWGSGSLVTSKWCHFVIVETDRHLKLNSQIHIRHIQSVWPHLYALHMHTVAAI